MDRQKCFVSLVLLLQTVVVAGPTAEEVLNKYTETLDKTYLSFITQAKSHVRKQQKFSGAIEFMTGEENKFTIQEFRTDGERMKVISQQWGDTYDNNQKRYFRPKSESNYQVDIYDGNKRYEHVRAGEDPGTLIVHIKDAKKSLYSLSAQIAQENISQCFGYMRGDLERFDRIIREAGPGKMTVKEEELNGTVHYVIDTETNGGKYTIWLNPEKGYNFSKAILVKKTGDLYKANYKLPAGMEQRTVVENTEFKKIDGLWVPVKAILKFSDKYPNGGYLNGTQDLELTTIQINPDHNALNSFSIDGIKDGARAMIPGVPIQYHWRNGELIPNIDEVSIDMLDKMTEEIMADKDANSNNENSKDTLPEITIPEGNDIFIPDANTASKEGKPFIFDFNTAKLVYAAGLDNEKTHKYLSLLGKGDIGWNGAVAAMRDAVILPITHSRQKPMILAEGKWCSFFKLPDKASLPYTFIVSRDKQAYIVQIKQIKKDGIEIAYAGIDVERAKALTQSDANDSDNDADKAVK